MRCGRDVLFRGQICSSCAPKSNRVVQMPCRWSVVRNLSIHHFLSIGSGQLHVLTMHTYISPPQLLPTVGSHTTQQQLPAGWKKLPASSPRVCRLCYFGVLCVALDGFVYHIQSICDAGLTRNNAALCVYALQWGSIPNK